MSVQRGKIAAQLRAARFALEALEAEVANAPRASVTGPESIDQAVADRIAIESASISGLLLDGMCELVTGDQFDIEDEPAATMQRQINDADRADEFAAAPSPNWSDDNHRIAAGGR